MVGGSKALVVTAERHRLVVICSSTVKSGPVSVKTKDGSATGPRDFMVLSWPLPYPEVDGPPYSFEGEGDGAAIDLRARLFGNKALGLSTSAFDAPRVGTAKILCVAAYPRDLRPTDEAAALTAIRNTVDNVTTYYRQASYSQLNVDFDVVGFLGMANRRDRYYRAAPFADGYPNLDQAATPQIWAECMAYAQNNHGRDLNAYDVFMVIINMDVVIRGWGWKSIGPNISFHQAASSDQDALSIDITLAHTVGSMNLGTDSDWGRVAHEFAHCILPPSGILPEDIYASGLPASDATATEFDLMGSHDSHPLFSGHNMAGLGWFTTNNVRVYNWNTSPFSQEVEIVAHGLTQNTNPSRCHLVLIQVSSGLQYYIEVRQRPGTTAQSFDGLLPVPTGHDGGVLVTRAITGTVNNNESIRLITLLQASTTTLTNGHVAVDPLRTIKITVINDNVQANPLVCKVKIEWAQPASPTPGGTFDLWITPWGSDYTSPDIWIDRQPYFPAEPYDRHDASGNPISGGDDPRVGEINQINARIRNSGTSNATNVLASFYVNTPPGIGDSGNWTPLKTITLSVPAGGDVVATTEWNPPVDEHTCLQVVIVPQTGEVSISNNKAQENIFTFRSASRSVPEPVELPIAVRNPLKKRTLIWINLDGVPEGFYVYFPRRWLYLEALSEETLELLVIPLREMKDFKTKLANIKVHGYLPWPYNTLQPNNKLPPASTARLIGGIQTGVAPKVGSEIRLQPDVKLSGYKISVRGGVTPPTRRQNVRVDMTDVQKSQTYYRIVETDARGAFEATFSVVGEDWRVEEVAFWAHIINATILAPADSNIVHFKVKADVPPR